MTFPRSPVSPPAPFSDARAAGRLIAARAAQSRGQGSSGRCCARSVPPLELGSRQQRARSSPAPTYSRSCAPVAIADSSASEEHRSGKKSFTPLPSSTLISSWPNPDDAICTGARGPTTHTRHRKRSATGGVTATPSRAFPSPAPTGAGPRHRDVPRAVPSPAATSIRQRSPQAGIAAAERRSIDNRLTRPPLVRAARQLAVAHHVLDLDHGAYAPAPSRSTAALPNHSRRARNH